MSETLSLKVLRAAAGQIVRDLPYDLAQREAIAFLLKRGLIYPAMVHDQQTHYATKAGRAFLRRNKDFV